MKLPVPSEITYQDEKRMKIRREFQNTLKTTPYYLKVSQKRKGRIEIKILF